MHIWDDGPQPPTPGWRDAILMLAVVAAGTLVILLGIALAATGR